MAVGKIIKRGGGEGIFGIENLHFKKKVVGKNIRVGPDSDF